MDGTLTDEVMQDIVAISVARAMAIANKRTHEWASMRCKASSLLRSTQPITTLIGASTMAPKIISTVAAEI